MVRSEIDDIFASVGGGSSSKGKKVAKDHQIEKKSQKKDSNGKSQKNDVIKTKADDLNGKVKSKDVNGKRKQPETIVDPSKALEEAVANSVKKSNKKRKSGGESNKKLSAEDEDFMDSRGSNRRKTDDGFAIYSEAELKLDQGGDTPLCPFDCDCCY